MSNNFVDFRAFESFVGTLNTYAAHFLTKRSTDGTFGSLCKSTLGLVAYSVIALAGLVEMVARTGFFLAAKTVQFLFPKQWTSGFDKKILEPLYGQAAITTAHTLDALTKTVTNLMSTQTRKKVEEQVYENIQNFFGCCFMERLFHLHINGFYQEEKKDTPPPSFLCPSHIQPETRGNSAAESVVEKESWWRWGKSKLMNGLRVFLPI